MLLLFNFKKLHWVNFFFFLNTLNTTRFSLTYMLQYKNQSCLPHIPSYFLSLFKIPTLVALMIKKMQRDFLWLRTRKGKKDHLITWDVVCSRKEFGGLEIGKTSLRDCALLKKWLWRFPKESQGLWHQVISSIYGTHPNGWDTNNSIRWSHKYP